MRTLSWLPAICLAAAVAACGDNKPSGSADSTSKAPAASASGATDAPPTLGTVSPNSGSGKNQAFTATYSHPAGADKVVSAWFLVERTLTGKNACFMEYIQSTKAVNLMSDAGTWQTPAMAGSSKALSNSQCAIDVANVKVSTDGNTLTVTFPVTFTPAYSGPKGLYLLASGPKTATTWVEKGKWTVQ
jgi:hypothetical protein